jgi:uncharacterized membrane protein
MLPSLPVLAKTAGVLFLVDLLWLATGGIWARWLAERIQGEGLDLRYGAAAVVYVFLAYLLLETRSYKQAFLYGVSVYGVYDFTMMAVFKGYDWRFALADTLWGGVLFVFARYLLRSVF